MMMLNFLDGGDDDDCFFGRGGSMVEGSVSRGGYCIAEDKAHVDDDG